MTWRTETKLKFEWGMASTLLSSISFCSVLSSSTCHPVIASAPLLSRHPPPFSAGSAGDGEASAHHNPMNDLTQSWRITVTPRTMKEKGCDDSEWWREETDGKRGIGRESIITSEKKEERVSCQFLVCRLQCVIQLNNIWLFSVSSQPDRERWRRNHYFNPVLIIQPNQEALNGQCGQSQVDLAPLWLPILELGLGTKKKY